MRISEWISASALFVAIVSLIVTQLRSLRASNRAENRTTLKLSIFYALRQDDIDEDGIVKRLKQAKPTERVDEIEVRRSVYEMLAEGTVEYTEAGKWAAVQHVEDD